MLTIVIPGESEAREIALVGEQLMLGRGLENEIVVTHPGVSRRHAVLRRDGFKWWIEDLGSAHGTFVNDARIQRHALTDGDVVRIGEYPHTVKIVERQLERDLLGTYAALQLATDEQRLVHADELEQQGQLDFANWVRTELELRQHPVGSLKVVHVQAELAELAKKVPPHLRALMAHGVIEGCRLPTCPGEWSKLTMGTRPRTRGCMTCSKDVTFCDTAAEGRELFPARIVVDACRERRPGDTLPMAIAMPVG